jgi:hypothetical protein
MLVVTGTNTIISPRRQKSGVKGGTAKDERNLNHL